MPQTCRRIKTNGQRCHRQAANGRKVCWQHGGSTIAAERDATRAVTRDAIVPQLPTTPAPTKAQRPPVPKYPPPTPRESVFQATPKAKYVYAPQTHAREHAYQYQTQPATGYAPRRGAPRKKMDEAAQALGLMEQGVTTVEHGTKVAADISGVIAQFAQLAKQFKKSKN
jgi:type IV secretory pathway VirB10-like protein|uniref:Uncharacterized protein n=1 Tax=viral metagenome TaxID=1070528 RepID=A0A6C0BKV6_9ZZZZ